MTIVGGAKSILINTHHNPPQARYRMSGRIPALTARTVFVGRGKSVDSGMQSLARIMSGTGLTEKIKRNRYYEKPTKRRERLEYEKCNRLYNREMRRKIHFIMRQHDTLPPV